MRPTPGGFLAPHCIIVAFISISYGRFVFSRFEAFVLVLVLEVVFGFFVGAFSVVGAALGLFLGEPGVWAVLAACGKAQ